MSPSLPTSDAHHWSILRDVARKRWATLTLMVIATVSLVYLLVFPSNTVFDRVLSAVAPVFFAVYLLTTIITLGSGIIEHLRSQDAITLATQELQQNLEDDFFTNLIKINFKYIDKYYLQTQVQADKSFVLSAFTSLVGFAVIVTGVIFLYLGKIKPGYVTTASGVLSEATAAVFFYLYNRTIMKMGEYHRKLVLTQNVSIALKIAQDLPEPKRTEACMGLIRSLSANINAYLTDKPRYEADVRAHRRRGSPPSDPTFGDDEIPF